MIHEQHVSQRSKRYQEVYTPKKKTAGTKAKCALCGKGKSININLGCSLLFNHSPIWYSTVNNMSQLWQIFLQLLWGSATINRKHDQDLNPTDPAKMYKYYVTTYHQETPWLIKDFNPRPHRHQTKRASIRRRRDLGGSPRRWYQLGWMAQMVYCSWTSDALDLLLVCSARFLYLLSKGCRRCSSFKGKLLQLLIVIKIKKSQANRWHQSKTSRLT